MAARKKNINFIAREGWETTSLGKYLLWALTLGRYVIVLTELIVIVVFLLRFKLDKDLAVINEEIKDKETLISSSQDFEKEAKYLQQRLVAIRAIEQKSFKPTLVLTEISKILPQAVTFLGLQVDNGGIRLSGTSQTNSDLATFISGLKASGKFTKIDLTSVSAKGEAGQALKFQLSTALSLAPKTNEK